MHMMFVDESGDPGYPSDGKWRGWKGSTFFTRIGVIIHGWKWKRWDKQLKQFKNDKGLRWDAEIKASWILKGGQIFSSWDKARRVSFYNDLLFLIAHSNDITILGVAIDKKRVRLTHPDRIKKPDVRSLELLLERYNSYLDFQKDKSGIVVLDPVCETSDDNLRYFQSYLQAYSSHLKPLRIVESTFFAKSHTCNMIQIADICSHVFYREMTLKNQQSFSIIKHRFWKHNGRWQGYGIKIWPEK